MPKSDHISPILHTSLASIWTKNWIQSASPCLQVCKQWRSVISVWPEVLLSFLTALLFLSLPSLSHFFIPSEILWTTQILVSGLGSIEFSFDLTLSFQFYICLHICSKDASFFSPSSLLFLTVVCVCVCVCLWVCVRERESVCVKGFIVVCPLPPPPVYLALRSNDQVRGFINIHMHYITQV